jgi:hypothetical protein
MPDLTAARPNCSEIGEDTDSAVAAEAVIGTAETLVARGALTDEHVQAMAHALDTIGPDYEARRTAAVIALAVAGRLDKFAVATERQGKLLTISPQGSGRRDDGYLRRILRHWQDFVRALGSEDAVITALLLHAGAIDAGLSGHIAAQVSLARTPPMPEIGFDLVAQSYRVVEHVLLEAIS